jgi:hypothetical protein
MDGCGREADGVKAAASRRTPKSGGCGGWYWDLDFYGGAGFVGIDFEGAAELGEAFTHAENADSYDLLPIAGI